MIPVGDSNGVIIAGSFHRLWRVLGAKYIFSSYEFLFRFRGKFWVGKTKMLMEKERSRQLMEAGLKGSITESSGEVQKVGVLVRALCLTVLTCERWFQYNVQALSEFTMNVPSAWL